MRLATFPAYDPRITKWVVRNQHCQRHESSLLSASPFRLAHASIGTNGITFWRKKRISICSHLPHTTSFCPRSKAEMCGNHLPPSLQCDVDVCPLHRAQKTSIGPGRFNVSFTSIPNTKAGPRPQFAPTFVPFAFQPMRWFSRWLAASSRIVCVVTSDRPSTEVAKRNP